MGSLKLELKLNETSGSAVADSSGNGNTGTLTGRKDGVITGATRIVGVSGGGLQFVKANAQRVTVPNSNALVFTTGDFSLSFWAKPTSLDWDQCLFCFGEWSWEGWYIQELATGAINFTTNNSGSVVTASSTAGDLVIGTWKHFCIVRTGSTARIYVNNVDRTSVASAQAVIGALTAKPFYMGAYDNLGAPYFFDGSQDEVRIYNRALSAAERSNLFNKVRVETGLVGEWLFDESSGDALDTHQYVTGQNNGAINFNGSSYGTINDATTLRLNGGNLSLVCLIKRTKLTGIRQILAKWDGAPNWYGWGLGLAYDSPNEKIQFYSDAVGWVYSNILPVADGNFHTIGVSCVHGGLTTFYYDGQPRGTAGFTAPNASTANIIIGRNCQAAAEYYEGAIDDVRVWNRALSAAEMKSLSQGAILLDGYPLRVLDIHEASEIMKTENTVWENGAVQQKTKVYGAYSNFELQCFEDSVPYVDGAAKNLEDTIGSAINLNSEDERLKLDNVPVKITAIDIPVTATDAEGKLRYFNIAAEESQ